MPALSRPWGKLHYRIDGPASGPVVVFANSLGTDLHLWDDVVARMPQIRAIRFDKRGHGLSDLGGEVTIEDFAEDAIALIEAEAKGPVIFAGLSIGGQIAQAVAKLRPDLIRGLVLSNTAAKMGTAEGWTQRIEAIRAHGIESIADAVMERWFAAPFRAKPDLAVWRNMMTRTDPQGYIAACGALAKADFTASTAQIATPTLVIVGDQDGASPPDLVEATARLIKLARFEVIKDVGHLPPVEAPDRMVGLLASFIKDVYQ